MSTPDGGGTEAGQHRLVGILNADVVGYSRLMSQDEDATVEMLNARRAYHIRLSEAARRLVAELQSIAPSLSAEQAVELVPPAELTGAAEKAEYVALLRAAGLP